MKFSVLIADDEPHSRRYLSELLKTDKEVELIGTCANGKEVLAFCKNQLPDIIFLDIKMPGISGIEVARSLSSKDCRVIFCTAYDEYAIKAFEVAALDYLLKPYSTRRFFEVLDRAKTITIQQHKLHFNDRIERMFKLYKHSSATKISAFTIKERGFEIQVKTDEIISLQASSVYVILRTFRKDYLYRSTIDLLSNQLPEDFHRIHRSYIINKVYIDTYKYLNNSTFQFQMSNGEKIKSSRTYKAKIANWLS